MATFQYTSVDAQGKTVSGQIQAENRDEAIEKLTAMGLQRADLVAVPPPAPPERAERLSAGESVELGAQLSQVAKAGLPMGPGLRALAEEVPQRRLARALRLMANRLDQGMTVEAAMAAEERRLPRRLIGLVRAATRSGHLASVLEAVIAMERKRQELRHRIWMSLAYPAVLVILALLVCLLFSVAIIPQFASIYADFGMSLPTLTRVVLWTYSPPMGTALVVVLVAVVALFLFLAIARPNTAIGQAVLYATPVLGPLWRYHGLAEFSRVLRLLIQMQVPLPEALRAAGEAVDEYRLRCAARRVAQRVETGVPLAEAIGGDPSLPARLKPLIAWGERSGTLADSFDAAAEMFEGEVGVRSTLLDAVVLPVLLILLGLYVSLFVIAIFLPLISLISKLSGGS